MQTGRSADDYVEVHDEPDHRHALSNEFAWVYQVRLAPGADTLWHRHTEDTIYFSLAETRAREQFPDQDTVVTDVPCGALLSRPHRNDPLIHQVNNVGQDTFHMVGAEALAQPPVHPAKVLSASAHTLELETDRFRAYRITSGEATHTVTYDRYGLIVSLTVGVLQIRSATASTAVALERGTVLWIEPSCEVAFSPGVGAFFAEWR